MHKLRSHSKGILGQHRKLEAQFPQFGVLLFTHLVRILIQHKTNSVCPSPLVPLEKPKLHSDKIIPEFYCIMYLELHGRVDRAVVEDGDAWQVRVEQAPLVQGARRLSVAADAEQVADGALWPRT